MSGGSESGQREAYWGLGGYTEETSLKLGSGEQTGCLEGGTGQHVTCCALLIMKLRGNATGPSYTEALWAGEQQPGQRVQA